MNSALLAAMAIVCLAQQPDPEFAVAAVKPNRFGNSKAEGSEIEKISLSPTGAILSNVSLRSAIRWAYDVRDNQIAGPGWLDSERYDIAANASATSDPVQVKAMMRHLLADRFQLQLHKETRDLPVYGLTVAKKGSKLKIAAAPGDTTMRPVGGALEFRSYTMAAFAERFSARPLKLDRVVVDRTGLGGAYDFKLEFADSMNNLKMALEKMDRGGADEYGLIFTALEEQLGLSLKAMKAPFETLVIDRANRVPTEN